MIYFHARGDFFASLLVVNDDLARKQLGHAGGVVLNNELFQFNRKRQLLQKNAVGLVQHRRAGPGAFGHQQVSAKGGVAVAQAVLGSDVGNHSAAAVDSFAVERHLRPHDQVAVEQTAHAHQHDGAVRGQVANFVGCTGLGSDHPAHAGRTARAARGRFACLQFHLPAATRQHGANALGSQFGRLIQGGTRAMAKGLQTLLADILLVGLQIGKNFRRVARNAQGGAGDQEPQNQ